MERDNDSTSKQKSIQGRIDEIMNKHRDQIRSDKKPDLNIIEANTTTDNTKLAENSIDKAPEESYPTYTKKIPEILSKEIFLDFSKMSMSKTDPKGIIEYANEDFMAVCGYTESELMGQPHSIVRHPDMPRLIFKFMWQRLAKGEGLYAIVKNLSKDGRYYWVIAQLTVKRDENGKIISYFARRKAAPKKAVYKIEKLYDTLRSIERKQNLEIAQKYFYGLLEEKELSYDNLILSVLGVDADTLASYFVKEKNKEIEKSFFQRVFG